MGSLGLGQGVIGSKAIPLEPVTAMWGKVPTKLFTRPVALGKSFGFLSELHFSLW